MIGRKPSANVITYCTGMHCDESIRLLLPVAGRVEHLVVGDVSPIYSVNI